MQNHAVCYEQRLHTATLKKCNINATNVACTYVINNQSCLQQTKNLHKMQINCAA